MTITRMDCTHEGIGLPGCLICDVRLMKAKHVRVGSTDICCVCWKRDGHEPGCPNTGGFFIELKPEPGRFVTLPSKQQMQEFEGFNDVARDKPYDFDPDPEAA